MRALAFALAFVVACSGAVDGGESSPTCPPACAPAGGCAFAPDPLGQGGESVLQLCADGASPPDACVYIGQSSVDPARPIAYRCPPCEVTP